MTDERRCDDLCVRDGDRELRFCGFLLGESSSRKGTAERWAEIAIHRTAEGRYIVSGIGRSVRDGEHDKHWAHVCEEAGGAIESLYQLDDHDIRYMTWVSRRALEQATAVDAELREAYSCETIG